MSSKPAYFDGGPWNGQWKLLPDPPPPSWLALIPNSEYKIAEYWRMELIEGGYIYVEKSLAESRYAEVEAARAGRRPLFPGEKPG